MLDRGGPVLGIGRPAQRPAPGARPGAALGLELSTSWRRSLGVEAQVVGDDRPQGRHLPLGQPGDGQHQVDQRLALGGGRDVQPAPDLGVLQGAQVAVDVQDHVVELVVRDALGQAQVAVDLGVDQHLPHLAAQGGQLGRVHGLGAGVGVEQLLEAGQVVVGLGPGHGRGRWSITTAWARRLACVPSPGSLTTKG